MGSRPGQEGPVERRLRERVEAAGGWCLKFTARAGVPDRVVVLGGRVLFVEAKRPQGGTLSKLQRVWHARLRRAGGGEDVVRVVSTVEMSDDLVDELLRPKERPCRTTNSSSRTPTGRRGAAAPTTTST